LLTLGVAQAVRARRAGGRRAPYPDDVQALLDGARSRFDGRMAIGVFRDVAFHPITVAPPVAPSTILLSDESASVTPDGLAQRLESAGWDVRRLAGVQHDMQLEAPDRVFEALADVL
jgi:pimeloyl-ACP methyl ester carboxylesterase